MYKLLRLAAFIIFFVVASTVGQAQDEEKVTVSSNLVSVNVSVTDSHGRFVQGLGNEQFEVYADGVRQEVAHFSASDTPFSIGIVYDMRGSTPVRASAVLETLKRFVTGLRREDDFFLLIFNERGSAVVEFIPTAEQIRDHLEFIPPRDPNSIYDAVFLAAGKLRSRPQAKRALLVISDGRDSNSRHGFKELRQRVREFDVQLYGIGIAGTTASQSGAYRWGFEDLTRHTGKPAFSQDTDAALGRAALDELARASGGTSYSQQTESEPELLGICAQIALELRRQYTVGFYPVGVSTDARLHKIRVRVRPAGGTGRLRLSYREGYQLPKQ